MCAQHDEPYHFFYGYPDIFKLFMEGFAPLDLVKSIDYSTLRRENVKGIDQKLSRRVGDLIFSFNLKNGKPTLVIVLLEIQRRNDYQMPLRLLEYTTLFWKRILNEKRLKPNKVPAVLSLVLYNGTRRWTSPMDVHACIDEPESWRYAPWTPNMRYVLVDISKLDFGDARLRNNPVSWFMQLEKVTDIAKLRAILLEKILPWRRQIYKQKPGLNEALLVFTQYCLNSGRSGADALNLGLKSIESEEDIMVMTNRWEKWESQLREEGRMQGLEKGREEGREEGLDKGLEKGRLEGLRLSVKTLLAEKFGSAGENFWATELEPLDIAPWQKILTQLLHVQAPQELQYKHLLPTAQGTLKTK